VSESRGDLAGRAILVTRPAERAQDLVERIERAGGRAIRFPVIGIEPVEARLSAAAQGYDAVVFVSPAAVAHGLDALALSAATAPPLAAVGPATRAALEAHGFRVPIEPVGSQDSEGLLRAPAFARDRISGRRVLVVRGEGGRETLADGLVARGAAVDYAEVYRRVRPTAPDPTLAADSDIVTVTSSEGLANLLAMLDEAGRAAVRRAALAVASERIGRRARALGFIGPVSCAGAPGDEGLFGAVLRCARALSQRPSDSS